MPTIFLFVLSLLLQSVPSAFAGTEQLTIVLKPGSCDKPGRTVPFGSLPTPQDLATDAYCAARLMAKAAPRGVLTVFGSARLKEGSEAYDQTREFARLWTKTQGSHFPIASGGGGGIMEAANRGAKEAGGRSLGFHTRFSASGLEPPNTYVTDSYVFASFAQREAELVDRAAGVLFAPGGLGTEWEIFETLCKIQTGKKTKVPVVLLGKKETWQPLLDRLRYLDGLHTISHEDLELFQVAESPTQAVALLREALSR